MKIKSRLFQLEPLKIAIAVIVIGIGGGLFTYILHELILFTTSHLKTFESFTLKTYFISLSIAFMSLFFTKKVFSDTSGSGIPFIKLSLVTKKGRLPKRMALGKFVTSLLSLSSGLSFGKEGPLVTISAAWGYLVSHLLKLNPKVTKILVSSGATAGLSAAFNAPIAAVMFTLEEVLGELNTKYLGPIIVTSVLASVTSYKLLGDHSTFVSLNYNLKIQWHLIFYLFLGILMSFVGYTYIKLTLTFKKIRKKYFDKFDYLFIFLVV